jgi:hypothetical protein
MAAMGAEALFEALQAAGIADQATRRVVIDVQAGEAPVVHIERYGDRELIDVIRALGGVEITREESGSGQG